MSGKEGIVDSFKAITGASAEESRFFLEANGWNLELATSAFLDSEEPQRSAPAQLPPHSTPPIPAPTSDAKPKTTGPKTTSTRSGGFATLRDVGNKDDGDDSDDEDVQKFYAGGQKSGQMIHYPKEKGKEKPQNDDAVTKLFAGARQQGATPVDDKKPTAPTFFTGQGFKLGNTSSGSAPVQPAAPATPQKQVVTRTIAFYKNGFTVDDGPLRHLDDPANQNFINDVQRGLVPAEMEVQNPPPGISYQINLVDNRTQEYKAPPKAKPAAFSGSGHTLGSTASTPPASTTTTTTTSSSTPASSSFQLDNSQPTTSIQIRLADGTRLVAKFNHTHTVGDLRRFVDAAKRGGQRYDLLTNFPQKVLSDNSQTIADAGLVNAVVVQKFV